jgi:hypothetical protein
MEIQSQKAEEMTRNQRKQTINVLNVEENLVHAPRAL